jgi:hypothetical protein
MRKNHRAVALIGGATAYFGLGGEALAEEGRGFAAGASGRAGLVTSEWSPSGFWLEADALGQLGLSRAFYVLGEVGFAVSRDVLSKSLEYHLSETHADEPNEDTRSLFIVPIRATIGWSIVDVFSFEAGGLVGPTRIEQSSTQCGDDGKWALSYGVFGGPALHFGPLRAAVHVQAIFAPIWRCTNGGTDPTTGFIGWPSRFVDGDPAPSVLVETISEKRGVSIAGTRIGVS